MSAAAGLNVQTFAEDLLAGVGIKKPSAGDLTFVEEWETAEGGNWNNSAVANPLNTTLKEKGSVNYQTGAPGSGVQRYPSWAEGLAATITTLKGSAYTGIVSALKNNNPAEALTALQASPWDQNHYPNGLPTSAAAAAYVKAHSSTSTGGKSLLQQAEGMVPSPSKIASSAANDVGGAISSALSPLVGDAKTGLTYAGFAAVGLVLIVGGLLSMTKGSRQKVSGDVLNGAQLGATPAAGSGGAAGEAIPPEAAAALA